MERVYRKIRNIVLAWSFVVRRKDPPYAKERRKICRECPRLKWGVCLECGCPIYAKPRILDEECPLGKW